MLVHRPHGSDAVVVKVRCWGHACDASLLVLSLFRGPCVARSVELTPVLVTVFPGRGTPTPQWCWEKTDASPSHAPQTTPGPCSATPTCATRSPMLVQPRAPHHRTRRTAGLRRKTRCPSRLSGHLSRLFRPSRHDLTPPHPHAPHRRRRRSRPSWMHRQLLDTAAARRRHDRRPRQQRRRGMGEPPGQRLRHG